MTDRKLFTVDEANALLPMLRHELELIRESLAILRRASASLPPGSRVDDGTSPVGVAALAQLHGAERRLSEAGVELKDTEQGLFDMPALLGERIVLLCWKESEPSVAWFHEVTTGFSGRQPLPIQTAEIERMQDGDGGADGGDPA